MLQGTVEQYVLRINGFLTTFVFVVYNLKATNFSTSLYHAHLFDSEGDELVTGYIRRGGKLVPLTRLTSSDLQSLLDELLQKPNGLAHEQKQIQAIRLALISTRLRKKLGSKKTKRKSHACLKRDARKAMAVLIGKRRSKRKFRSKSNSLGVLYASGSGFRGFVQGGAGGRGR